jgi:hypothetical protein
MAKDQNDCRKSRNMGRVRHATILGACSASGQVLKYARFLRRVCRRLTRYHFWLCWKGTPFARGQSASLALPPTTANSNATDSFRLAGQRGTHSLSHRARDVIVLSIALRNFSPFCADLLHKRLSPATCHLSLVISQRTAQVTHEGQITLSIEEWRSEAEAAATCKAMAVDDDTNSSIQAALIAFERAGKLLQKICKPSRTIDMMLPEETVTAARRLERHLAQSVMRINKSYDQGLSDCGKAFIEALADDREL